MFIANCAKNPKKWNKLQVSKLQKVEQSFHCDTHVYYNIQCTRFQQ